MPSFAGFFPCVSHNFPCLDQVHQQPLALVVAEHGAQEGLQLFERLSE